MIQNETGLEHIFHALADSSRLQMVERLSMGPASVTELAEPLDMALPSVLKHLKVLENGGLVQSNKLGRVRTYELNFTKLRSINSWLDERKLVWNRTFDRLSSFLIETSEENSDGE